MTATANGGMGEPAEAEGPALPLQLVSEATQAQVVPLATPAEDVRRGTGAGAGTDLVSAPTFTTAERPRPVARRRIGSVACAILFDVLGVGLSVAVGFACAGLLGASGVAAAVWAVLVPVILACFLIHGLYRSNTLRLVPSGVAVFSTVAHAMPLAVLASACVIFISGAPISAGLVFAVAASAVLPSLATVPLVRSVAHAAGMRFGVIRPQRVIVLGAGEAGDNVMQRLKRHGGIVALGMVDDDPLPGFETIGGTADLTWLCEDLRADRIIVAIPRVPWFKVSEILRPMIGVIDIAIVPSLYELMTWRSGTLDLAGMPLVPLMPAQHSTAARTLKRSVDLVAGSVALLVASPILLGASLAIKLDSRGPVFFRQKRSGLGGRDFMIWKLRTMANGSELRRDELLSQSDADGPRFKMACDPRVTRVGRFLRRFSIDELPQLFNVLGGSMSLVGPRPFPVSEFGALSQGATAARFDMQPGMTGLWQVSGRSDLTWDDLCRLDSVYVGSWSVLWDLRILLQTPVAVFRRWGAY
jgi:exopolysaccharide biosynthesis polyprenyl glycosylphosphotransferase